MTSWVTCHTSGCGNAGIALPMNLEMTDDETGETFTLICYCGVCGEEITDISDDPPSPETIPEGVTDE